MAVKQTIYEICPECGRRNARLEPDGSVTVLAHKCPKAPPGPPNYPRTLPESAIVFVAADDIPDPLTDEQAATVRNLTDLCEAGVERFSNEQMTHALFIINELRASDLQWNAKWRAAVDSVVANVARADKAAEADRQAQRFCEELVIRCGEALLSQAISAAELPPALPKG
jgi:hypothetical protein